MNMHVHIVPNKNNFHFKGQLSRNPRTHKLTNDQEMITFPVQNIENGKEQFKLDRSYRSKLSEFNTRTLIYFAVADAIFSAFALLPTTFSNSSLNIISPQVEHCITLS